MERSYNGSLRKENIGEEVKLYGWVNKARDLGGVVFIDLRDVSGIVQIVVRPESDLYKIASTIKNEYVLEVVGKVALRESINKNIPTGEIEVIPSEIDVINEAKPLPIDKKSNDEMRLKYRYLDLRREELQKIFITRGKVVSAVRNYLDS
nr:aspartate--tRNA ligase [Gammaproteobacteria bacterium]